MHPAVLKNLSYGMYVIGSKFNGRPIACVANSVIQISSSDPEKVLIALTKDTTTVQVFEVTSGLLPGETVSATGDAISVTLGP